MTNPKTETVLDVKIEAALVALSDIWSTFGLPIPVRTTAWFAYRDLHAYRSPETVAAMERKMGLAK